jgi:hypothetical protein
MSYIAYSLDWSKPVYFCPHAGDGFTVSTDQQKAQVFQNKKEALDACGHFIRQSSMTCGLKKI